MKTFSQFYVLNEERDHISTIRNLLALAERPGTPAEGENAQSQAERLASQYGVDLATLQAQPTSTPRSVPQAAPDPYYRLLRQFGWIRERRPQYTAYVSSKDELAGQEIIVNFDGTWSHFQYGNMRFGGNNVKDLFQHLQFNNG